MNSHKSIAKQGAAGHSPSTKSESPEGKPKMDLFKPALDAPHRSPRTPRHTRVGKLKAGLDTLARDLRFSLRTLARNRGFTTVAVLTLALGIGANTAMFSVVHGVILAPLSFPAADRAVFVWQTRPGVPQ